MNINSVSISGYLTRDAEKRATVSGATVVSFGIAVNDRRQNRETGEWEDVPNFIDCVVFGKYGDSMEQHLRKGVKAAIKGKLHYSSWETKDGSKRSKVEVVAEQIDLMSQGQKTQQEPAQVPYSAPPAMEVYDEEIPF